MKLSKKRSGFGLEVKTVEGQKGPYLFFRTPKGSYHTFIEVACKDAARDCGANKTTAAGRKRNAREMCKEVWDKS